MYSLRCVLVSTSNYTTAICCHYYRHDTTGMSLFVWHAFSGRPLRCCDMSCSKTELKNFHILVFIRLYICYYLASFLSFVWMNLSFFVFLWSQFVMTSMLLLKALARFVLQPPVTHPFYLSHSSTRTPSPFQPALLPSQLQAEWKRK